MQKKYKITVNGQSYDVVVDELGSTGGSVSSSAPVQTKAAAAPAAPAAPSVAPVAQPSSGGNTVKAPMPGTVLSIKVSVGQAVKQGDVLLILEAMKMENEITATASGVVSAIHVQAGAAVNTGDPMVALS